jgi:TPR repeat protein
LQRLKGGAAGTAKAAERGHAGAQSNLGVTYDRGEGVPQDYAEALRWYRKAAEQGHADAQFNLGFMYYESRGALQDYAEALRWYRKAAEQGHARAQFNVGAIYENGEGAPQDYVQAHMWLDLAASRASGDDQREFANQRDILAGRMTAQQIAEAHRLARAWTPREQPPGATVQR